MAKRIDNREPVWPAEFADYDPELYPSKLDWEYARVKWARAQGFKQYKVLPLIQRMAAATGVEPNTKENKR
jgi:hypothetical protein